MSVRLCECDDRLGHELLGLKLLEQIALGFGLLGLADLALSANTPLLAAMTRPDLVPQHGCQPSAHRPLARRRVLDSSEQRRLHDIVGQRRIRQELTR